MLFPFSDFSQDFCAERVGMLDWQFTPFQFIEDIQAFATKHSVGLARNKALFQVIFNILLISPLGFFECPYRLFDVDYLMLNTSGAVIGFLVTLPLRRETEKFLCQENFIIQKNILIL